MPSLALLARSCPYGLLSLAALARHRIPWQINSGTYLGSTGSPAATQALNPPRIRYGTGRPRA